jgi:hypothetical protein
MVCTVLRVEEGQMSETEHLPRHWLRFAGKAELKDDSGRDVIYVTIETVIKMLEQRGFTVGRPK